MSVDLMPFLWVIITLPILLLLQRWIHRHLHGLAFLITGNKNWAVLIYAFILFPGVVLHELSHWLAATILRVPTGSFSVLPKIQSDGSVQLGYVEYYKSNRVGPIRESLIGSAPLIAGTAAILLIGFNVFDIPGLVGAVQTGDVDTLATALTTLFTTNDFLVWLYLLFAISNAMMPSSSDRKAWPSFAIIMFVFGLVLYLLGLQDLFLQGLNGPVATIFGYLGLAFSLTIGVDFFFLMSIYIVEWLFSRLKGVDLLYSNVDSPPDR